MNISKARFKYSSLINPNESQVSKINNNIQKLPKNLNKTAHLNKNRFYSKELGFIQENKGISRKYSSNQVN